MEYQPKDLISITVRTNGAQDINVEIPNGMGLNLMEVLKAAGLSIPATCGGMALCATCRVAVLSGATEIAPAGDAEQDMLDTLPYTDDSVRLSCQIRVDESIDNLVIKLIAD